MSPVGRAKMWTSGTVALLLLVLLHAPTADCGNRFYYPAPARWSSGPPPTIPSRPVSYIAPRQTCQLSPTFEAGGRFYYTWNQIQLRQRTGVQINFVDRLGMESNSDLWEIYGGLRLSPRFAVTYHFVFPHTLQGRGIIPSMLTLGGAVFQPGSVVTTRAKASVNRIESEIYFPVSRKYRVGPVISADFVSANVAMASGTISGSESFTGAQLGIGGVIEYARSNALFVKAKSAYTFINDHKGFYFDAQVKAFPFLATFANRALADRVQPYLELGYGYKSVDWSLNNKDKVITAIQGVYVTLGVIF
jgi:hypothetical protein